MVILLLWQPELNLQLMSKRSATVKATCADLERIVVVTEVFFSDAANLLAPTIACLAKSSSTAFRVPSGNLLGRITELTRFDLQLLRTVFLKEKAHGMMGWMCERYLSLTYFVMMQNESACCCWSSCRSCLSTGPRMRSRLTFPTLWR